MLDGTALFGVELCEIGRASAYRGYSGRSARKPDHIFLASFFGPGGVPKKAIPLGRGAREPLRANGIKKKIRRQKCSL
jgi:hypothetical protein